MDIKDAIEGRHMQRWYTQEPVDRALIDRLIRAAAMAPSAYNKQPWRFHVTTGASRDAVVEAVSMCTLHLVEYLGVTDEDKIAHADRWYSNLGDAPVVIAISLPKSGDDALASINGCVSAGCALENLLLTAVSEGIGCCNITASFWVRERLGEILGLGDDREVISIVMLGHPTDEPPAAPAHEMDIATFHD
jgi:nitroreductase